MGVIEITLVSFIALVTGLAATCIPAFLRQIRRPR